MLKPIANLLPPGSLREHADYVLRYAGDEEALKRLKKAINLKYHPDKNVGDPNNAIKKFNAVSTLFASLEDPEKALDYTLELTVTHDYRASKEVGNTTYTIKAKESNILLLPALKLDLRSELQTIYDFSSDDLAKVDERFELIMNSFFSQMYDIKKPNNVGEIFYTHRSFESDLFDLSDKETHQVMKEAISKVKTSCITYDTFHDDCKLHSNNTCSLLEQYSGEKAFKKNVLLVYLRTAFQLKEKKTHCLLDKKNYAYAIDIALKLPLFLLEIAWIFLVVGISMILGMTPLFLFVAQVAIIPASITLLVWGASIILGWYSGFNLDLLPRLVPQYITEPLARGIDEAIEAVFDVKFSSSDFADIIFDINKQKISESKTRSSFFSWFEAPSAADSQEQSSSSLALCS